MIGNIYPWSFSGYTQDALDLMYANPNFSNISASLDSNGTYSGTADWYFVSDDDIAAAILASLDGFDPNLSNSTKATALTAMLREGGVFK